MANEFNLLLILLIMASLTSSAITIPAKNQDLLVAIEEMQTANYFTFVMLINMSPPDQKILGNVTFFMPNDKTLARTSNMLQESVSDFLLRHSIPSILLFEHLERIPSGSLIPSSMPEYMLNISNGGRRSFYLNNVKIISPNICTAGSSIRCHGIDGVLNLPDNDTRLPSCSKSPSPVLATPPTATSPPSTAPSLQDPNQGPLVREPNEDIPPQSDSNWAPVNAPEPSDSSPQRSGSSQWLPYRGLIRFLVAFAVVSIC